MVNNPFPGMNPWLEHPALWHDVHFRLIAALARYLSPLLSPCYFVAVESQAYIATGFASSPTVRYPNVSVVQAREMQSRYAVCSQAGLVPYTVEVPVPDVIEETYLQIREASTGQVITIIEILSPTNKRPGSGRQKYERKRLEIFSTATHLVEVDLLRDWPPMPMTGVVVASDYRILVRRGTQGNQANLYPFDVRDSMPPFPLPLQADDVEPVVDLSVLLDEVYAEANYALRLNYTQPPIPPLPTEKDQWARGILAQNEV